MQHYHLVCLAGTLLVGIAEEDTGRITEYTVPEGSAIVVPQGDIPSIGFVNADAPQAVVVLCT